MRPFQALPIHRVRLRGKVDHQMAFSPHPPKSYLFTNKNSVNIAHYEYMLGNFAIDSIMLNTWIYHTFVQFESKMYLTWRVNSIPISLLSAVYIQIHVYTWSDPCAGSEHEVPFLSSGSISRGMDWMIPGPSLNIKTAFRCMESFIIR